MVRIAMGCFSPAIIVRKTSRKTCGRHKNKRRDDLLDRFQKSLVVLLFFNRAENLQGHTLNLCQAGRSGNIESFIGTFSKQRVYTGERCCVPDFDAAVVATTGELCASGIVDDGANATGMGMWDDLYGVLLEIPDAQGKVIAATDQIPAIRSNVQPDDPVQVAGIGLCTDAAADIPGLNASIFAGAKEERLAGMED